LNLCRLGRFESSAFTVHSPVKNKMVQLSKSQPPSSFTDSGTSRSVSLHFTWHDCSLFAGTLNDGVLYGHRRFESMLPFKLNT
jgi:hypothetical protein